MDLSDILNWNEDQMSTSHQYHDNKTTATLNTTSAPTMTRYLHQASDGKLSFTHTKATMKESRQQRSSEFYRGRCQVCYFFPVPFNIVEYL